MNREQKRQYLKRYIANKDAIRCLLEEATVIRSVATKITQSFSLTPGGKGGSDKIQNAVDRLDGVASKLAKTATKLESECARICDLIESVSDPRYLAILTRRYLQGKTFAKICLETHYEYSTVMELHQKAIDSINI